MFNPSLETINALIVAFFVLGPIAMVVLTCTENKVGQVIGSALFAVFGIVAMLMPVIVTIAMINIAKIVVSS